MCLTGNIFGTLQAKCPFAPNPFGKSERSFSELVRRMERVRNCFGNAVRPQTLLECANSLGTRLTTFWNTWFGAKLLCCLLHFEVPRGSTKMSEVVRSRVVSQRVEAVFVCACVCCWMFLKKAPEFTTGKGNIPFCVAEKSEIQRPNLLVWLK